VGGELCRYLTARGHSIVRLVRRVARSDDERQWDPASGRLDPATLAGAQVVINLSGENITARRWTPAFKRELLDSRVTATRTLASALARLRRGAPDDSPGLFISSSAMGYYGYRGGETPLPEDAPLGAGFLAEVCRDWEAATAEAEAAGVRTVHLRLGIVLDAAGGPLAKMLEPVRKGMGGRLGGGKQLVSWIANAEIGPLVEFIAGRPDLRGPLNAVTPNPISNAEMNRLLCKLLGKREAPAVPLFVLRAMLGAMAGELLLGGQNVVPRKLLDAGYSYAWPELEPLLREMLGRRIEH
jgi:uncharacterized protein